MSVSNVYQVKQFIDKEQVRRDLTYSDTNINDGMMRQASLFAYYGELLAEASHQVDVVDLLVKNTEAAVYKKEREVAAAAGEKLTEVQLEKMITRNERVIAMKKALIEAKRVEAAAKTTLEAFRHRRDMLVQQSSTMRTERQGELRLNEISANHSVRDAAYQASADRALEIANRVRNPT